MAESIIDCRGLTKSFGTFDALVDCHLQVRPHAIVGLLGPNGAGKTTLLRTLLGFQRPTRGTARVCGYDCATESLRVRQQVAYLPGEARLFRSMSGDGVLRIFSGLSPHGDFARSRQVAERLDLDLRRRVMFMSTGMRQKLALAIVLGSMAPLVILDEPTANLDPNVRREVIGMVSEIRQAGRTVVMSSHIFSDIEDTCDEVIILRQGRLVHRQSIVGLAELHVVQGTWCRSPLEFSMLAGPNEWVVESQLNEGMVELQLRGPAERWMSWLAELPLAKVTVQRASVGSIYHRYHGG